MSLLIALLFLLGGEMPHCTEEDGSTQGVCVWSDGTGATVVNVDHGQRWMTL